MADLAQSGFPVESEADKHLSNLLAAEPEPWFKSLIQNLKDTFNPPKLPPLEVTSKPVAVKDIWGLYGRQPKSFMMSTGFQVGVDALLFTVFSTKVVQDQVKQVAARVMPTDLDPYVPN